MIQKVKQNCPTFDLVVRILSLIIGVIAGLLSIWMFIRGGGITFSALFLLAGGLLVLMLYFSYFVAACFYSAACDKGYTDTIYIVLPFFLGMIGYLLIIALPDRGHRIPEEIVSNVDEQITAEEPEESDEKTPMIKNIIKKNIPRLVILVFLLIVVFAIFKSCGFIDSYSTFETTAPY